jgi:hypothetical protein
MHCNLALPHGAMGIAFSEAADLPPPKAILNYIAAVVALRVRVFWRR